MLTEQDSRIKPLMILPDKTWAQLNSSMILYSICHESLVNQLKIVLAHELRNWIIKIYTVIFSNSSFVDSQGTRNWRFKYWRMDWPICWVFVSLLLPVSPEMTSTLLFWMEIHIFFQISILKQFQNESRYQFFFNWRISLKKSENFAWRWWFEKWISLLILILYSSFPAYLQSKNWSIIYIQEIFGALYTVLEFSNRSQRQNKSFFSNWHLIFYYEMESSLDN